MIITIQINVRLEKWWKFYVWREMGKREVKLGKDGEKSNNFEDNFVIYQSLTNKYIYTS